MQTTQSHQGISSDLSRIRLKYLLGEYLVWDLRLPARVYKPPFPPPSDFAVRLESLLADKRNPDVIAGDSWPISESEKRISIRANRLCYLPDIRRRYLVSLTGTFEEYLAHNFRQKTRKNIVRSVRIAAESGATFHVFKSSEEMAVFLCEALPLSKMTYQGKLLGVGLPDSEDLRKEVLTRAARDGVRGYLLRCDNKPVAFAYCEREGEALCYWRIGYDPNHSSLSPGTVLLYHLLHHVFDERTFRWFDFGIGESQYKAIFGTDSYTCADVFLFPFTAKNTCIVLAHAGLDRACASVGRLLEATGLKDTVRMWLRAIRGIH